MMKTFAVLMICTAATGAFAQDAGSRVLLHGFGEWAYARTDGNEYFDGNEHGDYDTVGLGLNATTALGDHLTIIGQFAIRTGEGDTPDAELDYAFAQWRFSDAAQLRFGRSKHPFGIYTEIFDVGTLRPFFHLPLSIYGPSEIAAQSYDGVGLIGMRQLGSAASIDYDLYVGEITFGGTQRVDEEEGTEQVRDVLGGRVRYHTAISGLSFGASAYTGVLESEEAHESEEGGHARHRGIGIHAEYAMAPLTIRAEVGRHRESQEAETKAFYVEAAYRIGEHYEIAGRFDTFDIESLEDGIEDLEHRDLAVGLNYWFTPNFVLKGSLHRVTGLAVAVAEDPDHLDDETNALILGAQFSF